MFVLHVELKIKPGLHKNLERTYVETFRSAISKQEGFESVSLLQPSEGDGDYRLCISFENQTLQQKWTVTDLHQEVWPQIESDCSAYFVTYYNAI